MFSKYLSQIDARSTKGRLLRFPLKFIPGSLKVKILQGYNKNFYWIVGSGVSGYWLGHYEFFKQQILTQYTNQGMIAYDIGAHVGFYTLLFSRLVGKEGHVYAFEPNPRNSFYLRRHLAINEITNVSILPVAIGKEKNFTFFNDELDSSMGHLTRNPTSLYVPVCDIDFLVKGAMIQAPNIIKIDVEGAEKDVFIGAKETIAKYKPIVQVAIDDKNNTQFIYEFLQTVGYKVVQLSDTSKRISGEIIASLITFAPK